MDTHAKDILKQIHISKVILPVLIGLAIVFFLIYKQFSIDDFNKIDWSVHVYLWIIVAIFLYLIRHLSLSARLHLLSNKQFSFLKSIELIFIWEFSSAVSPTSFGGSAVALFFLSQEKIKTSKAIALVLYTIILDSFFFLIAIPLFLIFLGPLVLRPDLGLAWLNDESVILIIIVYLVTLTYAVFLFIGIFLHPEKIRSFLIWMSKLKFLAKFSSKLVTTGENFIIASNQIATKNWWFHIKAIVYTAVAWAIRFGIINALIIAFTSLNFADLFSQLIIYGRSQNLYIISAYTPTPGSAGFSELLFNGFFKDFVPSSISIIVVIIWRLISYYFYLLAGVIVVPNWINKILKRRMEIHKTEI